MRIDTHTHSLHSSSSNLTVEFLIEMGRRPENRVIVCTDHGESAAYSQLQAALPGILVIPAIEVEAREAHFLVYSTDADYIRSLNHFDESYGKLRRDETTAVVWAHPCVSQREDISRSCFPAEGPCSSREEEQIAGILRCIDGLEVFNGTMLSLASCGLVHRTYFDNLRFLAGKFGLAETGGSDAHETEVWSKVWTEFPEPLSTAEDFIRAIKERAVKPGFDRDYFKADVG